MNPSTARNRSCDQVAHLGELNCNARHSDAVVRRARKIYERGYTLLEVRMHLLDEGHDVPPDTLHSWLYGRTRTMA